MRFTRRFLIRSGFLAAVCILSSAAVSAQPWTGFDSKTRYLAMGDSLSAGYGAMPATLGFTYDLYHFGAVDRIQNTLLCVMAVPGALSDDVLKYQVPQVSRFFQNTGQDYTQVITLTVGGNDLLQVLTGADPEAVLKTFGGNLGAVLSSLQSNFPRARIFVATMYDPKLDVPNEKMLILGLNQTIAFVAGSFPSVTVVDVYSAFEGRKGLLLSELPNSDPGQIHPTNEGYAVMARAFAAAIRKK